jgi:mRNA-degrading endonuclease RelE of RelBE toxin-antitoxin system
MTYRVDVTERATRDLRRTFHAIDAVDSQLAHAWFDGLETTILTLDENPARCSVTPEDSTLRHLLYGRRIVYRVIFAIDDRQHVVTVLHIVHGARRPFAPGLPPED